MSSHISIAKKFRIEMHVLLPNCKEFMMSIVPNLMHTRYIRKNVTLKERTILHL